MDNVIAQLLKVNPPDIAFVNVITWVVHCVEVYSQSINTGKGASKFAIFKASVPTFLQQAVALNLCTHDHAATLLAQFNTDWQVVSEIVAALIAVAHDPELVQFENEVKTWCAARRRKNGK
jgi:hypothetical protein